MKRIVRLTESDLTRIVRRVISEQKLTPENSMVGKTYVFNKKTCKVEKAFKLPVDLAANPKGNDIGGYLVYPSEGCRQSGIVDGVRGYLYMPETNGGASFTRFEWSGNDWFTFDDGTKAEPKYSLGRIEFITTESYRRRNYYI